MQPMQKFVMPNLTLKWQIDHAPIVWHRPDPYWKKLTDGGTVADGLLRMISGYNPRKNRFSRGPDSLTSLDTYSLGIAHWHAETAPEMLEHLPDYLIKYAWGVDKEEFLDYLENIDSKRGKQRLRRELYPFVRGWYEIARHPAVIAVQAEAWLGKYAKRAWKTCSQNGLFSALAFACVARVTNSSYSRAGKWVAKIRRRHPEYTEEEVCAELFGPRYDDHPDRFDLIKTYPEFKGLIPLSIESLLSQWSVPKVTPSLKPYRHDGSLPLWAHRN